jgi:hypothetical protein
MIVIHSTFKYDSHTAIVILWTFLCFSDYVIGSISSYKYHIHVASPRCESSYVVSCDLIVWISSHKYHIDMASRRNEFSYVLSDAVIGRISSDKNQTHMASLVIWIFLCFLRTSFGEYPFLQILHSYGFSPVWIFLCTFRLCNRWNLFLPIWPPYCF